VKTSCAASKLHRTDLHGRLSRIGVEVESIANAAARLMTSFLVCGGSLHASHRDDVVAG
jgi:hypothetical protein